MRFTNILLGGAVLAAAGLCVAVPANAATSATAQPPPAAAAMPSGRRLSAHRVAVLQEALDSTGANLTIDGAWGPATEAALRTYQRQAGLPVTGQLDHRTWKRLDPVG